METENAANVLATKVKDLSMIKERYNQLNVENAALQRGVAEADAELAKLRQQQQNIEVKAYSIFASLQAF